MRKTSQAGYSLFANLGFLALFLIAIGLSAYWLSLYKHKKGINEVVKVVAEFYNLYQDSAAQMLRNRVNIEDSVYAKNYELLAECQQEESFLNKNRKICALPLGELDIKIDYVYPYSYIYVYVHFTDMYKRHSCEQFLSVEWEKFLPKTWWGQEGYIGVISENTPGKIYFSYNEDYIAHDGAQVSPTQEDRKQICKVCRKSRYCSVLTFFRLGENIFKKSENAIAIQN